LAFTWDHIRKRLNDLILKPERHILLNPTLERLLLIAHHNQFFLNFPQLFSHFGK